MEEKTLINACLVFPRKDKRILLAPKLKKIGAGFLNGYGGGIEEGEDPVTAVIRELLEESDGVVALPEHLEKVAIVDFHNMKSDGSTFICKVHVFFLSEWKGEFKETDEMGPPEWFSDGSLPSDRLMPADPFWLPVVLKGKKIRAEAHYGPFQKTLLKPVEIVEVATLD